MERWKATNRYKQLQTHKRIFLEPKSAGEAFDEELEAYREAIRNTRNSSTTVKGAIFFAIFRGKISEGIDFSDDYARAVLVVGIPFPNVKDLKVGLKKVRWYQYKYMYAVIHLQPYTIDLSRPTATHLHVQSDEEIGWKYVVRPRDNIFIIIELRYYQTQKFF